MSVRGVGLRKEELAALDAAREESTRLSYMYLEGRTEPKLGLGYGYVYTYPTRYLIYLH